MVTTGKTPDGRDIWKAIRDELRMNLYPLPFTTLVPAVYHVYLHPDDYKKVEDISPRIVSEVQRALTSEVEKTNARLTRAARRVMARLLEREQLGPIEVPASGWEVRIQPDRNGELKPGLLGIVSTLALPAPAEYSGTPTTRIVKSIVGTRGRTASTTEVRPASATEARPASATEDRPPSSVPATAGTAKTQDSTERARLIYEDEQGPHVFIMRKDSLSVGRGGSSAWVDLQVMTTAKVSREHFRVRRDANGRFFIQDVSLWGTTVNGDPLPPAEKTTDAVAGPGPERELPVTAQIGLADALVMRFEANQGR
jgi:FHA domain-containing protein